MNSLKKYYFRLNEWYEQKQEDKRPIEKTATPFPCWNYGIWTRMRELMLSMLVLQKISLWSWNQSLEPTVQRASKSIPSSFFPWGEGGNGYFSYYEAKTIPLSLEIQNSLVTCFDQQNLMEVTLGYFHQRPGCSFFFSFSEMCHKETQSSSLNEGSSHGERSGKQNTVLEGLSNLQMNEVAKWLQLYQLDQKNHQQA